VGVDYSQIQNVLTTSDKDLYNLAVKQFEESVKKSVGEGFTYQWEELDNDLITKKFINYQSNSCSKLYDTILENSNNTQSIPKLTIYFGNHNLQFYLTDLLDPENDERCPVNFVFIYKKAADPNYVEGLTLGHTFFTRYTGLHYDFETSKIAFSGAHGYIPVPNHQKDGPGKLAIVLTSVIVGVGALTLVIFCCMKRRKQLQMKLESHQTYE
jgi:hypothetical protein